MDFFFLNVLKRRKARLSGEAGCSVGQVWEGQCYDPSFVSLSNSTCIWGFWGQPKLQSKIWSQKGKKDPVSEQVHIRAGRSTDKRSVSLKTNGFAQFHLQKGKPQLWEADFQ